MIFYFLSNLGMGGGGASPVALVSYVDPTAVALIASGAPSDVDPTAVTLIDEPAADSGVDPTQVTVIQ